MKITRTIEKIFEFLLWKSRFIVLVAVISSLFLSFFIFYIATVEIFSFIWNYLTIGAAAFNGQGNIKIDAIAKVVKAIDLYLLGIFVMIFALGLYELFISKIDEAENSEFGSRILLIKSFDDLKARLGSVVLLILIVKFFQVAMELPYTDTLNLLLLGIGIFLISGAIYLSFFRSRH